MSNHSLRVLGHSAATYTYIMVALKENKYPLQVKNLNNTVSVDVDLTGSALN